MLAPYDTPELLRQPLDATVLRIRVMDMGGSQVRMVSHVVSLAVFEAACFDRFAHLNQDVLGDCLDPPDADDIARASTSLFDLGALAASHDEAAVTDLGEIMASLSTDLASSVLLVLGHAFDCLEEAIVMAAYSSGTDHLSMTLSGGLL